MNTAWYVLTIDDTNETLMRCSPTGFETVPLRPALPNPGNPDVVADSTVAATPSVHSPYAPTDVGSMQTGEVPRATQVVDDLATTDDPTTRYLRRLGTSVREAIAPDPAPLYVAMDPDRGAMFQLLAKTPVRAMLDQPRASLSTLWSDTRAMEVNA